MKCRHCDVPLELTLVDLGSAPPSNAYLTEQMLKKPEKWFPLRVLVCEDCWLVQTEDFVLADELFGANYAYFSGFSLSWLNHCKRYVDDIVTRLSLGCDSHVVEVAANDGHLLQYFKAHGIPSMGIEPTESTAVVARAKGIRIVEDFFGARLARILVAEGMQADLMVANNVIAHVPNINDFAAGFAILLKPQGVATFEFPHLMRMVAENQFDTIYHEHFSYLSLTTLSRVFSRAGLSIYDVEEIPTHGGSLRVFAQRADRPDREVSVRVSDLLRCEIEAGMLTASWYVGFQFRAEKIKNDLMFFLLKMKLQGRSVAAYGAAAKGNTLLNFAGVKSDLLPYVADKNPIKQGQFLPGSRIPIVDEAHLRANRPDYILILPWNLREEVMTQLTYVHEWGGRFVTAVPHLAYFE